MARFGATAERVFQALHRCDPRADDLVRGLTTATQDHFELESAWRAYRSGAEQPEPVRALLDQVAHPPDWVDWQRVERARRLFERSGMGGAVVLKFRSLMGSYVSPAGTKPLVFSGRLQEQTARRLAETTRFVAAVCSPNGMRPGGEGWLISVRVRLMHAQVRYLLQSSGRWQQQRWAAPINQHDMLATMLLFSEVFIEGLRRLGFSIDEQEAEDWIHLWRLVAWTLGTEVELLPESHAQATALRELIDRTQGEADDDGRALAAALVHALPPQLGDIRPLVRRMRVGLALASAHLLLDDRAADQLALERNPRWSAVMRGVRGAVRLLERARLRSPALERRLRVHGLRHWQRLVEFSLHGRPARYARPAGLRRATT